jgi:hypothetical protein
MTKQTDWELAKMLGARQAFGLIAGRCSAADASILRDIREQKRFLSFSANWDDFCREHLHTSRRSADRAIRYLNEFGPGYFALAQLTQITPGDFRKIRSNITGNALEFGGEAIALIEENSARLNEAVAALCQPAAAPEAPVATEWAQQADALERRIIRSLRALQKIGLRRDARSHIARVMCGLSGEIAAVHASWS